jgi:hypothetical protein
MDHEDESDDFDKLSELPDPMAQPPAGVDPRRQQLTTDMFYSLVEKQRPRVDKPAYVRYPH